MNGNIVQWGFLYMKLVVSAMQVTVVADNLVADKFEETGACYSFCSIKRLCKSTRLLSYNLNSLTCSYQNMWEYTLQYHRLQLHTGVQTSLWFRSADCGCRLLLLCN